MGDKVETVGDNEIDSVVGHRGVTEILDIDSGATISADCHVSTSVRENRLERLLPLW